MSNWASIDNAGGMNNGASIDTAGDWLVHNSYSSVSSPLPSKPAMTPEQALYLLQYLRPGVFVTLATKYEDLPEYKYAPDAEIPDWNYLWRIRVLKGDLRLTSLDSSHTGVLQSIDFIKGFLLLAQMTKGYYSLSGSDLPLSFLPSNIDRNIQRLIEEDESLAHRRVAVGRSQQIPLPYTPTPGKKPPLTYVDAFKTIKDLITFSSTSPVMFSELDHNHPIFAHPDSAYNMFSQ